MNLDCCRVVYSNATLLYGLEFDVLYFPLFFRQTNKQILLQKLDKVKKKKKQNQNLEFR